MNAAEKIEIACWQFPDRTALSDAEGRYTYRELGERSAVRAAALIEAGLASGDRVEAFLPDRRDDVVLLLATLRAGTVFVLLNYRFAAPELHFALVDSGARFVAMRGEDLERMTPLISGTGVACLILFGEATRPLLDVRPGAILWLEEIWARPEVRRPRIAPRRAGDDALVMYMSGTTDRPKGVRQTHRNNAASIEMVPAPWRLTPEDRLLQPLPLFHVGGLQCTTLPALAVGARVHLLGPWDAGAWLSQLDAFRPTFSGLVTPSHVPERFEAITGVRTIELYGQTETTGLIATYDDDEARIPGSMGRLRREVAEVVLIAPDGTLRARGLWPVPDLPTTRMASGERPGRGCGGLHRRCSGEPHRFFLDGRWGRPLGSPCFMANGYEADLARFIDLMEREQETLWDQAETAMAMTAAYGRKTATMLASDVGVSASYVRQLVATAKAFPDPASRAQDLSFSHHRICAMTDDPAGWLERAVENGWSHRELRLAIRDARDRIAEAEEARRARERIVQAVRKYNERWRDVTGDRAVLTFEAVDEFEEKHVVGSQGAKTEYLEAVGI